MANLYEFTAFGTTYRYTSSITDKTHGGNTFTAIPISRGEIVFEMAEQHVKIVMPKTSEPATKLIDENINNAVSLKIMNTSGAVLFRGSLVSCNVGVDKDRISLKFSPDFLSNNSEIPTRTYTRNCNYTLYEGYNGSSEAASPRCPRNRKDSSLNPLLTETRTTWTFSNGNKTLAKTATDADFNIGTTDYVQGQVVVENSSAVYSSSIIISHSVVDNGGGSYTATFNLLYPLSLKDGSDVLFFYKGCDKKIATCSSKFGIDDHFGGFPEMPEAHLLQKSGYKGSAIGYTVTTDPKTGRKVREVAGDDSELGYVYDGVIPIAFGSNWVTPQTVWLGPEHLKNMELFEYNGVKTHTGNIGEDTRPIEGVTGFSAKWVNNGHAHHHFQSFAQVICEVITKLKGYRINGIPFTSTAELAAATDGKELATAFPISSTNTYFAIPLDVTSEDRFKYVVNKEQIDSVLQNRIAVANWYQEPNVQTIEDRYTPSYACAHFGGQTSIDPFIDNLVEGSQIQKKRWIKGVAYIVFRHNGMHGPWVGANDDITSINALSGGAYTNFWLSRMGAYIGRNVEKLPDIEYYIEHMPDLPSPYNDAAKSSIDDAANPICIIYWILSNNLGISDSDIDLAGFDTARDTVHAENLGVNIMLTKRVKTISFLNKILAVIDGALIWKTVGGSYKWSINLARTSDSVSKTITISNASNISFERMGWDKVFTGVQITYRPAGKTDDEKITHMNESARELVGITKIKKVDLAGVSTENTVRAVLSREFSRWTRPLSTLSFDYYDNENELYPNDLITLDLTDTGITYDINENFRVVSVSGLSEASNKRRVKCIQDYVISYTTEVFMPAPAPYGLTVPSIAIADLTHTQINEGWQELSYPNTAVTAVAQWPASGQVYNVHAMNIYKESTSQVPATITVGEWYYGELTANVTGKDSGIDVTSTGITFKVDDSKVINDFTGRTDQFFGFPRVAIIGNNMDEVLTFNKIVKTSTAGGYSFYRITDIVRNVFGVTNSTNLITGQKATIHSTETIWIGLATSAPQLPVIPTRQTGRRPNTGYSNTVADRSYISAGLDQKALVDFYARNNFVKSKKVAVEMQPDWQSCTPYPVNTLEQFADTTGSASNAVVNFRFHPTCPKQGPTFRAPDSVTPALGDLSGISWELKFKDGTNNADVGTLIADLRKGFTFPKPANNNVAFTAANCSIRQVLDEHSIPKTGGTNFYKVGPDAYFGSIEIVLNLDLNTLDIADLRIEVRSINTLGYKSEARTVTLDMP